MIEENPYHPLTIEQFNQLDNELKNISTFLPESQMRYIWTMYNVIRFKNENQPCACKSSAGNWVRAVNALKDFVKERKV